MRSRHYDIMAQMNCYNFVGKVYSTQMVYRSLHAHYNAICPVRISHTGWKLQRIKIQALNIASSRTTEK